MKTKIPAGYRITIESWENDADNYNTKVVEGLTEQDTRFIVDFALLFKSQNSSAKGIGNMYEPDDEEREQVLNAIKNVVKKHSPLSETLAEYFAVDIVGEDDVEDENYLDGAMEYAYDLGLSGGEFYTRVLDSIKVEFIETEIVLQDVTSKFVKGKK